MPNIFIRTAIRTLFVFQSRKSALAKCSELLGRYVDVCEGVDDRTGRIQVMVPNMRGVDEDMRNWSLFMILRHNAIVNESITATVCQLASDQKLHGSAKIDPKHDVMPLASVGNEQVDRFSNTTLNHIEAVEPLKKLRGTKTSRHPVFGEFDAHKWNCMFAFHLALHLPQAEYVVQRVKAEQAAPRDVG